MLTTGLWAARAIGVAALLGFFSAGPVAGQTARDSTRVREVKRLNDSARYRLRNTQTCRTAACLSTVRGLLTRVDSIEAASLTSVSQPPTAPPPPTTSYTVSLTATRDTISAALFPDGHWSEIAATVRDTNGIAQTATSANLVWSVAGDSTAVTSKLNSASIFEVHSPTRNGFVIVTARWTPTGASAGRTIVLIGPVVTPPPDTTTPPPPPQPPTGDAATKITAVVGPVGTAAHALYDQTFNQYFAVVNNPASLIAERLNNYYDRAVAYYARYARTGDARFLQLGHEVALYYRTTFLEPNTYGTQPHNSQVRGLEIHYRLTGDEASRKAVAGLFAHGLVSYSMAMWGPKADIENTQSAYMDNRIQARVLQGALSAYRMGASYTRPDGFAVKASEWPTRLRDILNKVLSTQNANGSYSWVQICGGQLNYMVGMLNDVLIEYYRDFEQDPRIPPAVERANEFLWSTQWLATDQAFAYSSTVCANIGGREPAGDLNGLLIASFGWLYQRTGDAKWRTRGEAILTGLLDARWAQSYGSGKQFNQAFAESYRYLGWR